MKLSIPSHSKATKVHTHKFLQNNLRAPDVRSQGGGGGVCWSRDSHCAARPSLATACMRPPVAHGSVSEGHFLCHRVQFCPNPKCIGGAGHNNRNGSQYNAIKAAARAEVSSSRGFIWGFSFHNNNTNVNVI